jgi:membrane associated rhomboid family serine protease
MGYRLLADAAMLAHLAFLGFVVLGGYLALWRPWLIVPHVVAAVWGFSTVLFGVDCPLTAVESWARERAGQAQLPETGFIDHYLTGVVYPEEFAGQLQAVAFVLVVASWVLVYRRRSAARAMDRVEQ